MQPEDKVLHKERGLRVRRIGNRNFECSLYLKKTLRDILPRALSEVCQVRPADPIEYLATLLYKAADSDMYFQEKAVFSKEMQEVASQMKREYERRQHAISLYKRQIYEFKRFVDTRNRPRQLRSGLSQPGELSVGFLRKRGTSFNVPESTVAETASELESRPDLNDDLAALKPRRATLDDKDQLSSRSSSSARVSPVTPDSSSRRSAVSITSERSDPNIGTQKTYRALPTAKPRLLTKIRPGSYEQRGYSSGEESGTKKTKQVKKLIDQRPVADSQSPQSSFPTPASRSTPTTQAKRKPPRGTEAPTAERPAPDWPRYKTRQAKVTADTNGPETTIIDKMDSSAKPKTKEGKGRDKKVKGVTILGRQNLLRAEKPLDLQLPPRVYWLPPARTDTRSCSGFEVEQNEEKSSERETTSSESEEASGLDKMKTHSDQYKTKDSAAKAAAAVISKAEASGSQVEDERDSEDARKEMKFIDIEDEDQSPSRIGSPGDWGEESTKYSEATKVARQKKMKKMKTVRHDEAGFSSPTSSNRDIRSNTEEDDEFIPDDEQSSVGSTTPEIEGKKTIRKPISLAGTSSKRQERLLSIAGASQETTAGQENARVTKAKKKKKKSLYAVDSSEDTSEQITPQTSRRQTLTKDRSSRKSTLGGSASPRMQGSSFSQERQKKKGKKPTDTSEVVNRRGKDVDVPSGEERDVDVLGEEEMKRKVRKRHRKKKITDESEPEPERTDDDILVSPVPEQNISVASSPSKLVSKKTTRKIRPKAAKGKMVSHPSFSSVLLERAEEMNELDEFECEDEAESTETIPMPSVEASSKTPEEEMPFTPVECVWYLVGARTLVCQHPVLGEIQAKGTAPASSQDFTGWMAAADYVWQSFYDPETYTLQNPWEDDKPNVRRRQHNLPKDARKQ